LRRPNLTGGWTSWILPFRRQGFPAPAGFAVPELFFNEMLAVRCRLLENPAEVVDYMNALQDLGLHRIGNGRELLAAGLAKSHSITGYAAVYAACAKLTGGLWITADRAAWERLASTGLTRALDERG
jgi:predicted nucleic acid-binding protein